MNRDALGPRRRGGMKVSAGVTAMQRSEWLCNRRPKVVLVLVFRVMGWYGSARTGKTVHSSVLAVVLASKVVKTGQKTVKNRAYW